MLLQVTFERGPFRCRTISEPIVHLLDQVLELLGVPLRESGTGLFCCYQILLQNLDFCRNLWVRGKYPRTILSIPTSRGLLCNFHADYFEDIEPMAKIQSNFFTRENVGNRITQVKFKKLHSLLVLNK